MRRIVILSLCFWLWGCNSPQTKNSETITSIKTYQLTDDEIRAWAAALSQINDLGSGCHRWQDSYQLTIPLEENSPTRSVTEKSGSWIIIWDCPSFPD